MAFILIASGGNSVWTWILFLTLILGHLLFFFKSGHRTVAVFSMLCEFAGLSLFLFSVWLLNAEGTTWGAGPAIYGLALIIPSLNTFWSAARSREDDKRGWYAVAAGGIGVFATFWRMHEVDHMLRAGREFWAPNSLYQNLGLCFSVLLLAAGLFDIFLNDPMRVHTTSDIGKTLSS